MSITKEEYMWGFKTYYRQLCYFCTNYTKDVDDAEDIVQDTYVRLYNKMDSEKTTRATIKAFLFMSVANTAKNYLRHRKTMQDAEKNLVYKLDDHEDVILPRLIRTELMSLVYDEIERIPPARREVFKMAYLYDMSNSEIADELNLSKNTIKDQKYRAIAELRARFKNSKLMEND